MKKHHKKREGRHATKADKVPALEDRVGFVEDRLASMSDDIGVIIGTLGDLQDRLDNGFTEETNGYNACPVARIEPSNVTGSPYNYLYIYLTPQGPDGPHVIVSDASEFGEDGIRIGRYEHYEVRNTVIREPDKAIKHIAELIG